MAENLAVGAVVEGSYPGDKSNVIFFGKCELPIGKRTKIIEYGNLKYVLFGGNSKKSETVIIKKPGAKKANGNITPRMFITDDASFIEKAARKNNGYARKIPEIVEFARSCLQETQREIIGNCLVEEDEEDIEIEWFSSEFHS